jgi:hypothetical protein
MKKLSPALNSASSPSLRNRIVPAKTNSHCSW